MRFDVIADEADGDRRRQEGDGQRRRQEGDEADGHGRRQEADGQRLRAVKVHPCLCEYSCAVHDNEVRNQIGLVDPSWGTEGIFRSQSRS